MRESTGSSTHTLTRVDCAILDNLHDGRATKGALIDWTGFSRNSLYNRLEILEAKGFVACVHEGTRLFELRHDPRAGETVATRSEQTLKELSQQLDQPIVVGNRVFEDGDKHSLDVSEGSNE